jgi:hypothetical protein
MNKARLFIEHEQPAPQYVIRLKRKLTGTTEYLQDANGLPYCFTIDKAGAQRFKLIDAAKAAQDVRSYYSKENYLITILTYNEHEN